MEYWLFVTGMLAVVLFKIAIIAAGTTSIILGYKLFSRAVFSDPAPEAAAGSKNGDGNTDSDVHVRAGEYKLTVRRAAPGTLFALFGAALIGITAIRGIGFSAQPIGGQGRGDASTDAMVFDSTGGDVSESLPSNERIPKIDNNFTHGYGSGKSPPRPPSLSGYDW